MKNISESINAAIEESRTRDREIAAYLESWVKQPSNDKEMFSLLGAIVEGLKNGLAYREDPDYIDKMDEKYKKASEVLKTFVGQLK